MINGWGTSCELALRWTSLNFTEDKRRCKLIVTKWCNMTSGILVNFGWGNGLPPFWHQALTETSVDLLSHSGYQGGLCFCTRDNTRNNSIVWLLWNEKCMDLMLGLKCGYQFRPWLCLPNNEICYVPEKWTLGFQCGHHYLGHESMTLTFCRSLLYPPYPKDRGMLWFYVEAARRPQWC